MKTSIGDLFHLLRGYRRAKREGRTAEYLSAARENARIQQIMMRPMTHNATNGSAEIGWGTAMLCFALSSYASVIFPNSSWRGGIGFLFLLAACLAMPLSLWAIKRYVTWPRTGYVAFQRNAGFWLIILVSGVLAAVISVAMVHLLKPEMNHQIAQTVQSQMSHSAPAAPGTLTPIARIILIALGPINAFLYLMMNAVSIKEHRWKWPLSVLLALGPLAFALWVPGDYIQVSRPATLFIGLVCFISGIVTLVLFLRRHPATPAEAE
jgi:hypothetical protein